MVDKVLLLGGDIGNRQEAGSFGRPIHTLADQLKALIGQELGLDVARILAEPVVDPHGRRIDWYTEAEEDPLPYVDLSAARRQVLLAQVDATLREMQALAERYRRSDDPARSQLGSALAHAIARPDAGNLFEVDGHPVMTFWGFVQDEPLAESQPISPAAPDRLGPDGGSAVAGGSGALADRSGTGPADETASGVAAGFTGDRSVPVALSLRRYLVVGGPTFLSVVGAGVGALLLVVGLWLGGVLPPRFALPALGMQRPAEANAALVQAKEEELLLRARVAELTGEVARKQAACVAPASSAATTSPPLGPALHIPVGAARNNDLSFLAGRWVSVTGLQNVASGTPLEIEYTFDTQGAGKITVREKGGRVCTGAVKAEFDAGAGLVIQDATGPRCDDGREYNRSRVVCAIDATGKATCHGEHDTGGTFDMGLHRG